MEPWAAVLVMESEWGYIGTIISMTAAVQAQHLSGQSGW